MRQATHSQSTQMSWLFFFCICGGGGGGRVERFLCEGRGLLYFDVRRNTANTRLRSLDRAQSVELEVN